MAPELMRRLSISSRWAGPRAACCPPGRELVLLRANWPLPKPLPPPAGREAVLKRAIGPLPRTGREPVLQRANIPLPKTLPAPERELVAQRTVKPLQLLPRPPPVSPGKAESGASSMAGATGVAAPPASARSGPPLVGRFVGRLDGAGGMITFMRVGTAGRPWARRQGRGPCQPSASRCRQATAADVDQKAPYAEEQMGGAAR